MSLRSALATVFIAGCSLKTSLTGGSSVPVGSQPSSSTSSNGPTHQERNDAEADARRADRYRYIPGNANCEGANANAWMEKHHESCDPREPLIIGLSVADAKKKIAGTKPDLTIEVVEQDGFDKDCKADHVCGFEPRRWYAGLSNRVTILINRKLDIGPPAD